MHVLNELRGELRLIPSGREGTIATLKVMRSLARSGKKDLRIRTLAVDLTNGAQQKAWTDEIRALHRFVRDQIRYVRDIRGVETVQTPAVTLSMQAGDCDDKSTLLAALLESIGHPTRFVAIGFAPDDFEHVFVETKVADRWIPLETTEPVEMGWTPHHVRARLTINN